MLERYRDYACLVVDGPDQPGLVAAVAGVIRGNEGNIVSLDQYTDDPQGGHFYQRVVFQRPELTMARPDIEGSLDAALRPLGIRWSLVDQSVPKRAAILVSKSDHCLLELLWRRRRGLLDLEIPMVISNHTDLAERVRTFDVPYFYVPSVAGPDKSASEAKLLELIVGNVDFVILGRYMQILSSEFLTHVGVPVINIHHSFLPAFIGANPYRQAKQRGVKLIGATAHYVTEDLDEGPIIEQDVSRVTHAMTEEELRAQGAAVERAVLARAVKWHSEDRVIRHGNQTIVFA